MPTCRSYKTSLQGDGSAKCVLAISVTCRNNEPCGYNLKINIQGLNIVRQPADAQETFTYLPPGPILQNAYVNSQVNKGQVKYFYFPVDYQTMGESMILVNKTQIYGTGKNGDVRVMLNVQANTLDNSADKYTEWIYPTN